MPLANERIVHGLNVWEFSFPLDNTCGTQSVHADDYWTYKNGLTYTFAYGSRHIAFKCKYPDNDSVGLAEAITIVVVINIEGYGEFSLELDAFRDEQFEQPAHNSLNKGDDLFVQVK